MLMAACIKVQTIFAGYDFQTHPGVLTLVEPLSMLHARPRRHHCVYNQPNRLCPVEVQNPEQVGMQPDRHDRITGFRK